MVYPWQQKQWEQLVQLQMQQRLPHALLLNGIKGLGKASFTDHFIRLLLCENKKNNSCNECQACHLINAGTHPNILWISPEKEGQAIKIDQIREATIFINQTALLKGQQIVVISPANSMNINSANALLKTLEEPPPNSLLILLSDENARLPATIQSRCQHIKLLPPSQSAALAWLNKQAIESNQLELALHLAQGAPLLALEILQSNHFELRKSFYDYLVACMNSRTLSIKFCETFKECDLLIYLDLFNSWLLDLLKLQMKITNEIVNADYKLQLKHLATNMSAGVTIDYIWQLLQVRKQCIKGINLNKQMLLENLILKWFALA